VSEIEATFGFVDLAGFTALTEAHGDNEAVALLDRFEAITTGALGPSDRLVKTIGDAVMIVFGDPDTAITAVSRLFRGALGEDRLPIPRAGLHHGHAIDRNGDYFGATVNLAARVAGQAHGGQVLATDVVAAAARGHGVNVVELGGFELRNISQPVEIFELEVCPAAAGNALDPVCRMQVARAEAAGRLRHGDRDYWFCSLGCAASFASEPERYTERPS
jgi:adenylate cyclase